MHVMVTGATGFIGRHLCTALAENGHCLSFATRSILPAEEGLARLGDVGVVGDLGPDTDWHQILHGADAVVHLASRVHVMHERGSEASARYYHTNVLGTRRLAEAARASGVKRFVFVSSVKAVGETGHFGDDTIPTPIDEYGRSKLAAEHALLETARGSNMAVIILRPPLVYGPGVGANFLRLLRLVERRLPLPLAKIDNARSLVYVGNLVSAVRYLLEVVRPISGTFFVSDGNPVSTPDLIRVIALAMNLEPRLWSCPLPLLRVAASISGKRAELDRLAEDLVVDSPSLRNEVGWYPPFSLSEGMRATFDWYPRQP